MLHFIETSSFVLLSFFCQINDISEDLSRFFVFFTKLHTVRALTLTYKVFRELFREPQNSLWTGSQSGQVSNRIAENSATSCARLELDCTGDRTFSPIFSRNVEKPFIVIPD